MSKANSPTSSTTNPAPLPDLDLPGDPSCPICGGQGLVRLDVPVNHPEFGKLHICACRQAQVNRVTQSRLFALSQLNELRHLVFGTFQPTGPVGMSPHQARSVEQAFNQAQIFAQKRDGWLLMQGPYGVGKTHLAAAIANFAVDLGVPTLFITVPDLLDTLRFTYNSDDVSFEERFEEIRRVHLLILDDFGTQNATPWAQEKLFQILNFRYINRLPLVVTTNLALEDIEGRIRSRLVDPELVTRVIINASDYRQPSAGDLGHHELSALSLMTRFTFSNFDSRQNERLAADERNSLDKAVRTAMDFAENPRGWLVFVGDHGVGKTHLAAAIANYRAGQSTPPLFIVAPDLLDHLRATFNPQSNARLDRRFDEIRRCPLLILDDLGTQSATPWAREKLYQLFNHRYNAELPTVITMATSLEELARSEPRLASRILDRHLVRVLAIIARPYRGEPTPGVESYNQGSTRSRRR